MVQAIPPASQIWINSASHIYYDKEKTIVLLEDFTRKQLFPLLKFVSAPEMVAFSWEPCSLCQMVCKHFHVNEVEQIGFWAQYYKKNQ